jgi:hypothetical protein
MFVLPGVLGWVTSLGATLRGIPPDGSDLMGISPRINLHGCTNEKNRNNHNYTYLIITHLIRYTLRYNYIIKVLNS